MLLIAFIPFYHLPGLPLKKKTKINPISYQFSASLLASLILPLFLHTCRGWQQSLEVGCHGNSKQVAAGYRWGVAQRSKHICGRFEISVQGLHPSPSDFWALSQGCFGGSLGWREQTADLSADGYHCLASQELYQRGLNRKKETLRWISHRPNKQIIWLLLLLMKPISVVFFLNSQLLICCMEGSTVLCAKTTFTTKTWNRSPKTSRERHGKCKVRGPKDTLCRSPRYTCTSMTLISGFNLEHKYVWPQISGLSALLAPHTQHQIIFMADVNVTKKTMLMTWVWTVEEKK